MPLNRQDEEELSKLLPDNRYMDPPDGGNVSVTEQIIRMVSDLRLQLEVIESEGKCEPFCRIDRNEFANIEKGIWAVVDIPNRHEEDIPLYLHPDERFRERYYTLLRLLTFYGIDINRGLKEYRKYN